MTDSTSTDFEPKIMSFLCNWCSYAGADLAGISRFQYPPHSVVVRVMCTGTISPHHILKSFQKGADGVLVSGCHIGDCHYMKGNYMTIRRVGVLRQLIEFAGIDPNRLQLEWVSASEGQKFADTVTSFTETVKKLGPLNLEDGMAIRSSAASPKPVMEKTLAEDEAMLTDLLRDEVRQLLDQDEIDGFMGLKLEHGHPTPHLFTKENLAELDSIAIGTRAYALQNPLRRLAAKYPDKKFGVMARGCDERALRELFKYGQLSPENTKMVGVACSADAAQACRCSTPYPSEAVHECKAEGVSDSAIVEEIAQLPQGERLGFWLNHFHNCLKCYGCKNGCPVCACTDCTLSCDPLIAKGETPPENPIFHLTRAMHMAGRCIDCGLCEEACPSNIPLRTL